MDNKEKQEKQEKEPSKFSKFIYLYKTYPGIRALVKLSLYGIFFIIFIGVIAYANGSNSSKSSSDTTTTTTNASAIKYQDIIDKFSTNSSYNASIIINDNKYEVDGIFGNNILSGTFESASNITKFKIRDNIIYQVTLDGENETDTLLDPIYVNFLVPSYLGNILKTANSIKTVNDNKIVYTYYNINENNVNYTINVTVISDVLTEISIISGSNSYTYAII